MSVIHEFNREKANLFVEKLLGVLNNGALSLMLSIGHRTGLFDALGKLENAATSAEIAAAADLNERYVREWLGAMVTGQIVEYNPKNSTYQLPPEHAAFLTRAASPNNVAVTSQWIPLLASVEDQIIECFRQGGGVPYSAYSRFHEVMAEESDQTTRSALVNSILPIVPGLNEKLKNGIDVLEIGCGSGRALNLLANAFPNSRFSGYDFSEQAVEAARREAAENGATNVNFEAKDAAMLGEIERYDLVLAFDAIHDQAKPAVVLQNLCAALKPDGTFLMQDIAGSSHVDKNIEHPVGTFGYTVSCLHCMTVSLSNNGEGLGAMWGEEKAIQMLKEAGFTKTEVHRLPHDILNYYYVNSKN
ncbi:MAG TPA: methyltransferase domain-containing protein [Pyrinomonadaceae bacterium]|jgi:2-polyprenyl-3-methyl-5-hydroxy-6-metoxy-1,4-benzoquinol methylase